MTALEGKIAELKQQLFTMAGIVEEMIADSIKFFKDHGKTVFYDAEHSFDGYKNEPEYALATWQAAEKAPSTAFYLKEPMPWRLLPG